MARVPINFSQKATGTFTVTDYSVIYGVDATTTITITNYAAMTGGNFNIASGMATVTEGVNFNAVTSNTVTAVNIVVAFNNAGLGTIASSIGAVIYIDASPQANGATIVWSGTGVSPTTATLAGGVDPTTITVGATTLTYGREIALATSNSDAATNTASAINISVENATVIASASGAVVTVSYNTAGTAGNSYAISKSGNGVTVSGATLSGGSNGTNPRVALAWQQNLLGYSNTLIGPSWTASELSQTGVQAAPNGSTTAVLGTPTVANTPHYNSQGFLIGNTPGTYTVYGWAKASGYNWLQVAVGSAVVGNFNVGAGGTGTMTGCTGTCVADPVYVGSGYYFFTMTCTLNGTGSTLKLYVNNADSAGELSYSGNGTSGLTVWAVAMVRTNYAPPYYETTGAGQYNATANLRARASGRVAVSNRKTP